MEKIVTSAYDYIESKVNPLLKEGWVIKSVAPFPVMVTSHNYNAETAKAVIILEKNEEVKL